MTKIDIARLSPQERIELITELWDSLDTGDVPLSPAQADEIDRRRATLDEDIGNGRDAQEFAAELRRPQR